MFERLKTYLPERLRPKRVTVPVVRLFGPIGLATPLRSGLSLAAVTHALERAFSIKKAPAVVLLINSPGGSPVQSRLIFARIRALAEEHEKPVIAFTEDVAASGGYMIALAADEIIADETSIVGSIGVIYAAFGFDRLIEKIGVDRRVHTAGERKLSLDPFQPERPADVTRLKAIQRDIHETFIDMVRDRRGKLLRGTDRELYSGEFWSGKRALELGLIDRLGDPGTILRERFGEHMRMKLISTERSLWRRRIGVGGLAGMFDRPALADEIVSAVEARALWARYGL